MYIDQGIKLMSVMSLPVSKMDHVSPYISDRYFPRTQAVMANPAKKANIFLGMYLDV